jgi:hypothetical protein
MALQHSRSMKHGSNDRIEGVCGSLFSLRGKEICTSQSEMLIGVLIVPQVLWTGVRWNPPYDSRLVACCSCCKHAIIPSASKSKP